VIPNEQDEEISIPFLVVDKESGAPLQTVVQSFSSSSSTLQSIVEFCDQFKELGSISITLPGGLGSDFIDNNLEVDLPSLILTFPNQDDYSVLVIVDIGA